MKHILATLLIFSITYTPYTYSARSKEKNEVISTLFGTLLLPFMFIKKVAEKDDTRDKKKKLDEKDPSTPKNAPEKKESKK